MKRPIDRRERSDSQIVEENIRLPGTERAYNDHPVDKTAAEIESCRRVAGSQQPHLVLHGFIACFANELLPTAAARVFGPFNQRSQDVVGARIDLIRKDNMHVKAYARMFRTDPKHRFELRDHSAGRRQYLGQDDFGAQSPGFDRDLLRRRSFVEDFRIVPSCTLASRIVERSHFECVPSHESR